MMKTFYVLMENKAGALARITGLLSARGINIHSLNVSPTLDESRSALTVTVHADEKQRELIHKQLNKLIHVIEVKCEPTELVSA